MCILLLKFTVHSFVEIFLCASMGKEEERDRFFVVHQKASHCSSVEAYNKIEHDESRVFQRSEA